MPVGAKRHTVDRARVSAERDADGLIGVGVPGFAPLDRRCRRQCGARPG